jgi:RNA polymerase sigma-70 factor (ECF subfamily)
LWVGVNPGVAVGGRVSSSVTVRLVGISPSKDKDQAGLSSLAGAVRHDGLSDEALMACICEGDKEALAFLFRRYARVVRAVAYRVLRDTSEADDLLQDIFLLVHRKCSMFDASRGPARFWILQMTYHRALGRRRYLNSRHFYTRVDLDEVETQLIVPEGTRSQFEDSADSWRKVFEALSENQRQTIELFFVEGYTLGEIALKLNQTRGNVKNHYFRGLEKLRKKIFSSKLPDGSAV